jgi:REP element-mobilizing transposase RayT
MFPSSCANKIRWPRQQRRASLKTMANTYTQIYIHVVFAVEGRQNLIRKENKEELQKYIAGIVTEQQQKLLAVHCMPDHTHILIGLKPDMALSDVVGAIKAGASNFINRKRWLMGRFSWQAGFGAFSYSHSQLTAVIRYIQNQEQHHARKTFHDEYLTMLEKFNVPHDERYIFKPVEKED